MPRAVYYAQYTVLARGLSDIFQETLRDTPSRPNHTHTYARALKSRGDPRQRIVFFRACQPPKHLLTCLSFHAFMVHIGTWLGINCLYIHLAALLISSAPFLPRLQCVLRRCLSFINNSDTPSLIIRLSFKTGRVTLTCEGPLPLATDINKRHRLLQEPSIHSTPSSPAPLRALLLLVKLSSDPDISKRRSSRFLADYEH